jgi:hypothetical protein
MSTMSQGERRRARRVVLGLAAVAVGLVACGDDGGEKGEASAGAFASKEAYCAAMAKVDAPFTEAGQYASREQKVEAAKKVVDLLDATAKAAPPDIAAAAKTKLDAIRTTAGGDPSALIDSETLDATQKIKDYCPA